MAVSRQKSLASPIFGIYVYSKAFLAPSAVQLPVNGYKVDVLFSVHVADGVFH